jgi:cytochrome c-type biogenesis protein CcmE
MNVRIKKKKKSMQWMIGGLVIIAAVVSISFLKLGDNLVYFYTPAEAYAKAAELDGQTVKVGAMIVPGSVQFTPENLDLNFTMSDLQGHDIRVQHKGTPPDMFKEGQGVVVEGRLTNGGKAMVSHLLMVKHSEEYKPDGDHTKMDKMLLEKSLFKE